MAGGLFDPNTFGGGGVYDPGMFQPQPGAGDYGLLARIAQMQAAQPQPPQAPPAQAIPPQAQQAQPQASGPGMQGTPQGPQPGAPQGGGLLSGLLGFLGNHQNAMMGLGAGIASGGLQRGVPMMTQGNQQDYERQMKMAQLNSTYQALRTRGVSDSDARLMLFNPEAMKAYSGNLAPATYSLGQATDPNTGQPSTVQSSSRGGAPTLVNPASLPRSPLPQDVAALRANPGMQGQFDLKFGSGAAQRALSAGTMIGAQ